jgi:hypothetical protein
MGNPDRLFTAVLKSPNDYIHVTQKGVYEILEVAIHCIATGYLVHIICLL